MKNKILALTILLGLTACQTVPYQPYARDVKKKPNQNGTIALKLEHRDEDRAKAQMMMEANCRPAPVKVLEEGEVVIGQESSTNSSTAKHAGESPQSMGSFLGIPLTSGGKDPSESTNSKVSTTQLKEWQISYECVQNQKKSAVK
jgi:hypothetical protein